MRLDRDCCSGSGSREKRDLMRAFVLREASNGRAGDMFKVYLIKLDDCGLCELKEGEETLRIPRCLPKERNSRVS